MELALASVGRQSTLKINAVHYIVVIMRTIMTSAPPSLAGRRGPPEANQYLFALSSIHEDSTSKLSEVSRCSASLTPCRMLCMFLVILKTPGFGFGTYLCYVSLISSAPSFKSTSVPLQINIQKFTKSNQSMAHESNTTTLGCTTEECDLNLPSPERRRKSCHTVPSCCTAGLSVIFQIY